MGRFDYAIKILENSLKHTPRYSFQFNNQEKKRAHFIKVRHELLSAIRVLKLTQNE